MSEQEKKTKKKKPAPEQAVGGRGKKCTVKYYTGRTPGEGRAVRIRLV